MEHETLRNCEEFSFDPERAMNTCENSIGVLQDKMDDEFAKILIENIKLIPEKEVPEKMRYKIDPVVSTLDQKERDLRNAFGNNSFFNFLVDKQRRKK